MANSEFTQTLVEALLSWMQLITSWVWDFFQADKAGGFLSWFSDHWMRIALFLIIVGLVVDWLIWMIRWRPYWLWLRKRQIIYEEVETPRRKKSARSRASRPQPVRHLPQTSANEYEDPFASGEVDPYAISAVPPKPAAKDVDSDWTDWDADSDPYAAARADDDSIYARPAASSSQQTEKQPRRNPVPNARS